jgi:hypothetical protein
MVAKLAAPAFRPQTAATGGDPEADRQATRRDGTLALADPALRWRAAPLSFRGCHQTDPSPALTATALAQFDKRRAVRSSRDGWLLTIPVMAEVMPTIR